MWSVSFISTRKLSFAHMLFYLVLFVFTHAILLFPKIGLCPFRKIGGATAHIGCFHWKQSPVRSSAEYLILPFRRSLCLITFLWRTEAREGLKVQFGLVTTLIKVRLRFHIHRWLWGCIIFWRERGNRVQQKGIYLPTYTLEQHAARIPGSSSGDLSHSLACAFVPTAFDQNDSLGTFRLLTRNHTRVRTITLSIIKTMCIIAPIYSVPALSTLKHVFFPRHPCEGTLLFLVF